MSTLEKTINLLNTLPERQVEIIYTYAQFLDSQRKKQNISDESIEDILNSLIGAVPDDGKSLEEYREERIMERYGFTN